MSYYVFITERCKADAQKMSFWDKIKNLKAKLEQDQTTAGLDRFPVPFLKKNLGRKHRLIIEERFFQDDCILCFLRVFNHDREYEKFLSNPEQHKLKDLVEAQKYWEEQKKASDIDGLNLLSSIEQEYLHSSLQSDYNEVILESEFWVQQNLENQENLFPYYEILEQIVGSTSEFYNKTEMYHSTQNDIKIIYRYFPTLGKLYLVAPINASNQSFESQVKADYGDILDATEMDEETLLRKSRRSYPMYIVLDRLIWIPTQKSLEANLALSPEEVRVLESTKKSGMSQKRYPLFVNGRPGSGKSTVLQYIFADYLYFHLNKPKSQRLEYPPLLLTYNKELLNDMKSAIKSIIKCNAIHLLETGIKWGDLDTTDEFNRSFGLFPDFMYSLLSEKEKSLLDWNKRINFTNFRNLWNKTFYKSPDHEIRKLSPELAWHVIRTYIKGMQQEDGDYLHPYSYQHELPKGQKTVTQPTFDLVYHRIWESWYGPLCKSEGYWDDQDLARRILDSEIDLARSPVIFCDEAQDFTKIELETLWRLSLFSKRKVPHYHLSSIPFAFAGDPFQTVNPTGFDWPAVEAGFHEKIVQSLDKDGKASLSFNFQDLKLNYRSTSNIVRFCNLIHLIRGIIFDIKALEPQNAWFEKAASAIPEYFLDRHPVTQKMLREQSELVIIVPCQEGEEEDYVQNDEFLKSFAMDENSKVVRNVLSPMRAKGRQFSRVVLYKFGKECAQNYQILLDPLHDNCSHIDPDKALPLEYFVNRLYVASSRAQNRLFIVDTDVGMKHLWRMAKDIPLETIIEKYSDSHLWKVTDIVQIQPGREDSIEHERDNPFDLAENFFNDGKATGDPYLLRMAAKNYEAAGEPGEAKKALAMAYEFEEEYGKAADLYLELKMYPEASECYWIRQNFTKITELGTLDSSVKKSIKFRAAVYMGKSPSALESKNLLDFLDSKTKEQSNLGTMLKNKTWNGVYERLLTELYSVANDQRDEFTLGDWKIIDTQFGNAVKLGLLIPHPEKLAIVACRADEPKKALSYWDSISPIVRDEPKLITVAKSRVLPYPSKLTSLYALKQYDIMLKEFWANHETKLSPEDVLILFEIAQKTNDLSVAIKITRKYPEERRYLSTLNMAFQHENTYLIRNVLAELIIHYIENNKWQTAIAFVEQGRLSEAKESLVTQIKDLKLNKTLLRRILISQLALSSALSEQGSIKDKNRVAEYLKQMILSKKAPTELLVSVQYSGAAIEKAGKIIDALQFYEDVYKNARWGYNEINDAFSRIRWAKTKMKHAELDNDSKKRNDAAVFQKKFTLPEFREIPAFPVLDHTEFQKYIEEFQGEPRSFEEDIAAIDRKALGNNVFSIKVNKYSFTCLHFKDKRKLEIRNDQTAESVFAFAEQNDVRSLEVDVTEIDDIKNRTWVCAAWEMKIILQETEGPIYVTIKKAESEEPILKVRL